MAATHQPVHEPANHEPTERALTIREAADAAGVHPRTIRRKLHAGEMPGAFKTPAPHHPIGVWCIPVTDLRHVGILVAPETLEPETLEPEILEPETLAAREALEPEARDAPETIDAIDRSTRSTRRSRSRPMPSERYAAEPAHRARESARGRIRSVRALAVRARRGRRRGRVVARARRDREVARGRRGTRPCSGARRLRPEDRRGRRQHGGARGATAHTSGASCATCAVRVTRARTAAPGARLGDPRARARGSAALRSDLRGVARFAAAVSVASPAHLSPSRFVRRVCLRADDPRGDYPRGGSSTSSHDFAPPR